MKFFISLTLCILALYGKLFAAADSIIFHAAASPVEMRSRFSILEDDVSLYTPDTLFTHPELFKPISDFTPTKHGNIFWLFTRIQSPEEAVAILSFKHLTDATLYIMPDTPGAVYQQRYAGAFRPAGMLTAGDSRFHFQLKFEAGITYRLLIRSLHTKQYKPVFDFKLDDQYRFYDAKRKQELVDLWFQGAGFVLLLYVLINWFMTRYRPYLWTAIFSIGFLLYNLALNRYFIDWFFPEHPLWGWRMTIHFLHLGLAGLYLLILDFWKVKERNHFLYQVGKFVLYGILLLSILSFLFNYYTGNFKVMSQVNGFFIIVQVAFLVRLLMLWKSFDKQQRFLGYGVILYLAIGFFATVALFFAGEAVFSLFTILCGSLLVIVTLLFLTGINGKLWQNEKDKSRYLAQLNQLQQEQNQLLETSVAARTHELHQRNSHIELLMNELNHRVKNNLQLLYSINSLQLDGSRDIHVLNILKDNVARIKAMMLVNDSLNPEKQSGNNAVSPMHFITKITAHSQQMFNRSVPVHIQLDIDESIIVDAGTGLCLGLIVTELLTNSYKHAFANQPEPQINLTLIRGDKNWQLHYRDNGKGIKLAQTHSFGLRLIADLTRQLRGNYQLESDTGVDYFFTFPNTQ